jgi:hypothetical protein
VDEGRQGLVLRSATESSDKVRGAKLVFEPLDRDSFRFSTNLRTDGPPTEQFGAMTFRRAAAKPRE